MFSNHDIIIKNTPNSMLYKNIEIWHENGKRHRDDGPAVIIQNGNRFWYRNGQLHREDGPAVERGASHKEWWINGKRHRDDGPAIIRSNGSVFWFLDDVEYKPEEWIKKAPFDTELERVIFKLKYM